MKDVKKLKDELKNCGKIPIFEIPIIKDGKEDFVVYNISIDVEKGSMRANEVEIDIDTTQTLDWHLEGIYDAIIEGLTNNSNLQLCNT